MDQRCKTVVGQSVSEYFEDGKFRRGERHVTLKVPAEPPYVKEYSYDVLTLNGIKGAQRDVLTFMAHAMDYENVVVLSSGRRKIWAKELGVSISTINNAVSWLLKNGFIVSKVTGEYIVDPKMFAKGEWKDIIERRESFDAEFVVSYEYTEGGYKRRFRKARLKPDKMTIDPETGEAIYTRKGKPCAAPTPDDVVESYRAKRTADES